MKKKKAIAVRRMCYPIKKNIGNKKKKKKKK